MKKCVILGNRGMLGSHLAGHIAAEAPRGWQVEGYDLPEVDIADAKSAASIFAPHPPHVVINCAAYTDVDAAESHVEEAFRANAVGPELLARGARRSGALLVHVSTDFVFDGARAEPYLEDDPPAPATAYGKSKLAGELAVTRIAPHHLVVRTAWLYGPNGGNFVDTVLRIARDKGELRVVNDQHGSPTYTGMLSRYLWKLVVRGARGTFHVAGAGGCTWYELARYALDLAGIPAEVTPVTTEEFPRPAPRPKNSVLDCTKAETFLGERLPPWQASLREYLGA